MYQKVCECFQAVQEKIDFKPEIALILGSGLGDFAETIEIKQTLAYEDIAGFPQSTVAGHKGRFVFGYVGEVPVVIMQGRVHYYEGYTMSDVVLPIRLMKMMGAKTLFLTNAAGGINENYQVGDFMMIRDHISSFIPSPLIGKNIEEFGPRFPDMCEIYDKDLRAVIQSVAKDLNIGLQEGVYIQFTGPAYESPAEIKMSRTLGADAVGMSTACEAIVANHMGMKICGISCISNMAAGILDQPLNHQEVQDTADRVAPQFKELVRNAIVRIYQEMKK